MEKDTRAAPPRSLMDSDLEELEGALRAADTCQCDARLMCETHEVRFREEWECSFLRDKLLAAAPSLISDLRSARKLLGEAQNGLRNVLCVSLPVDVSGERMVQIARDALAALDAFP